MKTRIMLSCSCAVAALLLASAGPSAATSLREALAIAYETNPELIAARANLRAVDEQVNLARAGMRPQVDAGVSYDLETSNSQLNNHRNRDPFTAKGKPGGTSARHRR